MVIVDASVVVGLISPAPYSEKAASRVRALKEAQEELYAPALIEYEVCTALRQAVIHRTLTEEAATAAIDLIQAVGVQTIAPASSLDELALAWAARLQHSKAYDAQYLALAEQMGCSLLTADRQLARAAHAAGAQWVESLA
jgi:predicted nucleic acid-binding protein